jgi:hypothetical protein
VCFDRINAVLNSRVQSVFNENFAVLAMLFPSIRCGVLTAPGVNQPWLLCHRHRVLNPCLPARRERMIQPQIKLMGLVNRILSEAFPILVIV